MSEFLFENPVTMGVVGAALTLVAAVTWIKGGYAAALYSAVALFLLTLLLISLNLQIQTDREKVRGVIDDVASAVRRNDLDGVLRHVHGARSSALSRAQNELPQFKFEEARVTGMKSIEVNADTAPPTAIAEFNVYVELTAHGTPYKVPRFVRCYFVRESDRWLVSDYEHFEPTHGFKMNGQQD